MEQTKRDLRWLRATGACLLALVLLMMLLPSTGGIIAGPPLNPDMWRCGPFLFFPGSFFGVVGIITVLTACTLFGIVRRNKCELVGWILFGLVIFIMFFA
jgi:hypothetical protein